jgi:hypothetical protein
VPRHLYIYYRIAADAVAARSAIERLMADVEASTGVKGRLLARCDDASTWMEVYEAIADVDAFSQTLSTLVERHAAIALTKDGRRHTECFAPMADR